MRHAILILLAAMVVGCSPAKRLQRLLDKHPELADTTTVTLIDTVIVPGDTVLQTVVLHSTDTVTIASERQTIRVVRVPTGSPCDTAAFRAEILGAVKPDTVVVTNTVEVPRLVPCPRGKTVAAWWRAVAIVLALVLLLSAHFKR
jgi:hypothetical protein